MAKSDSPIESAVMWQCPVTKRYFPTKEEAERSRASARASETRKKKREIELKQLIELENERSEYLKNNARTFAEIFSLIKDKAKEFWDIDFRHIHVSQISISEAERYGRSDEYKGAEFRFRLTMEAGPLSDKAKAYIKKASKAFNNYIYCSPRSGINPSISDLFYDYRRGGVHFKGIRTGSGNGGRFSPGQPMTCDARIRLDDFPLIKKRYEKFIGFQNKMNAYRLEMVEYDKLATNFSYRSKQYVDQAKSIRDLENELTRQRVVLKELEQSGIELFMKAISDELPLKPEDTDNVVGEFYCESLVVLNQVV